MNAMESLKEVPKDEVKRLTNGVNKGPQVAKEEKKKALARIIPESLEQQRENVPKEQRIEAPEKGLKAFLALSLKGLEGDIEAWARKSQKVKTQKR